MILHDLTRYKLTRSDILIFSDMMYDLIYSDMIYCDPMIRSDMIEYLCNGVQIRYRDGAISGIL